MSIGHLSGLGAADPK